MGADIASGKKSRNGGHVFGISDDIAIGVDQSGIEVAGEVRGWLFADKEENSIDAAENILELGRVDRWIEIFVNFNISPGFELFPREFFRRAEAND